MEKLYYICEVIHYLMYGLRILKQKCGNRKLKTEIEVLFGIHGIFPFLFHFFVFGEVGYLIIF